MMLMFLTIGQIGSWLKHKVMVNIDIFQSDLIGWEYDDYLMMFSWRYDSDMMTIDYLMMNSWRYDGDMITIW